MLATVIWSTRSVFLLRLSSPFLLSECQGSIEITSFSTNDRFVARRDFKTNILIGCRAEMRLLLCWFDKQVFATS